MPKYHVNAKGEAGKCSAVKGNCPFGQAEDHFPSAALAAEAYEQKMSAQTFPKGKPLMPKLTIRPGAQDSELRGTTVELSDSWSGEMAEAVILNNSLSDNNLYAARLKSDDVEPSQVFYAWLEDDTNTILSGTTSAHSMARDEDENIEVLDTASGSEINAQILEKLDDNKAVVEMQIAKREYSLGMAFYDEEDKSYYLMD